MVKIKMGKGNYVECFLLCFIGLSSVRPVGRLHGSHSCKWFSVSEELSAMDGGGKGSAFRALFLPELLSSAVVPLWGCSPKSE